MCQDAELYDLPNLILKYNTLFNAYGTHLATLRKGGYDNTFFSGQRTLGGEGKFPKFHAAKKVSLLLL
jgi:hypothetical protein